MMRATLLAMVLAAALGCGASSSLGTSHGDASDTCAGHRVTDACMNEAALAACQAREAECPGRVLVLESCPLQFACPR